MKSQVNQMKSIWDVPFVVIDVETTGTNPKTNRLTDIACVTVLGGEIISEYTSLINPRQVIPEFIERMTGISNSMAREAPEAKNILPEVKKLFNNEDAVFTAHNAQFDHPFVNKSLQLEKMEPIDSQVLCTLKLARRILDKDLKKNLGSVSDFFNIKINNRHRAYGDALATAKVLIRFLEIAEQEFDIHYIDELLQFQNRPANYYKANTSAMKKMEPVLDRIPKEPGVYYLYDNKQNLMYIGKAKSLKTRVGSYFRSSTIVSRKIARMRKKIADVKWECTGTELAALLLESKEIKKYRPPYNTVDKIYKKYPFIKIANGQRFADVQVSFEIEQDGSEYFGPFRSISLAESIKDTIDKKFKLRKCEKNLIPGKTYQPCLFYQMDKCYSPCSNSASTELYDAEKQKVKDYISGYSSGIIEQFEKQMHDAAENLEFEKAQVFKNQIHELRKLFERSQQVPTSINKNNIILILPSSKTRNNIQIFLIKTGKLLYQDILESIDNLSPVLSKIKSIFFTNDNNGMEFTYQDINELRIINSWSYSKSHNGRIIYIDGKSEKEIKKEFLFYIESYASELINQ